MENVHALPKCVDVRLMVADADSSVRDIVQYCAHEEGWECDAARDGIAALKLLRKQRYSLIILEAELPEIKGDLVCTQIRKSARTPVIFLSRHSSEGDRLAVFQAGGNDFVVKPFFPRELFARARSLLWLCGVRAEARDELVAGNLRIDFYSHIVTVEDRPVSLTPREYDLLAFFCKNQGKAFSRDVLLDLVWGRQFLGTDRTVDTHVRSLRGKIGPCQSYIVTVWGYGYKFEA